AGAHRQYDQSRRRRTRRAERARSGHGDVRALAREPGDRGVRGRHLVTVRVGVVLFPGTNCELDVQYAVEQLGGSAELLWHGDDTNDGVDALVAPPTFAHGDYLRTGAIARFPPVMNAVGEHARAGGPVIG